MRRTLVPAVAVLLSALSSSLPAIAGQAAYVVVVDYTAEASQFAALQTLIQAVAKASIAEPGCLRFDVVAPADRPNHLTLYEVFTDKAAFEAHAATPHFKQFVIDSGAIHATRTATPGTMIVSLQNGSATQPTSP